VVTDNQNAFPKHVRLLKKSEFSNVFDDAKRVHRAGVTLLVRANGLSHARFGLAVSKKQVRRAVDRNKIKRLARESFRLAQADLARVDIVLLVRGDPAKLVESLKCHLPQLWQSLSA